MLVVLSMITFSCLEAQITISEILYQQPTWDDDLQYIEFLNYSDSTVNLSGWSLTGDINLSALPDLEILAGENYVFTSDLLGMFDAGVVMDMGQWAIGARIFGDPFFILSNPAGEEVARIDYKKNSSWPEPQAGVAIELCDPTLEINDGLNWALAENSIISGSNELIGSPGAANTCTEIGVSSIERLRVQEIKIFPNPCEFILNIEFEDAIETITVYSMTGSQLLTATDTDQIDVSTLNSGVYMIQLSSGGIESNQRFLKI